MFSLDRCVLYVLSWSLSELEPSFFTNQIVLEKITGLSDIFTKKKKKKKPVTFQIRLGYHQQEQNNPTDDHKCELRSQRTKAFLRIFSFFFQSVRRGLIDFDSLREQ